MLKSQIRAEEYRAKAAGAAALAKASVLETARNRHRLSAEAWTKLAVFEERHGTDSVRRATAATRKAAAPA